MQCATANEEVRMGLLSKLFKICNKSTEKPNNKKFISSNLEQDEDEITAVISSVLISMDEEETMVAITVAIAAIL
jgi:uncharacterized protein (UPF0333 family)